MESSRSSTPAIEPDAQMLGVGKQCSHEHCLLVDFLPIKCQHCRKSFCGDHFKVEAHHCQHYDESKYNRVAPNCPMCNVPVAIKPGQDPNIRMEEHLDKECAVMTGKAPSKSMPTCGRGNCKKVLYTPIKCDKCRKDFCATHRFPKDHNCSAASVAAKPSTSSRLGSSHPLVARFSASSSKNTTPATAKKATTSNTASIPNISIPTPSLFDKTDSYSYSHPATQTTNSTITTYNNTNASTDQCKPKPMNNLNPYIPRPLFSAA
ncbi:hypothetical protein M378DRAFT_164746 [Amanita muscaria Koide BX008]|uniref:AN1-type domain-containing protein n=1 Tax=Amanita muscaria (strain Koide BX008) TaxID=946122 RepID=A0A0C2T978_AMAMK|nr:hypothetical protein M378DRAFT_164746 [Amanita muscaria Koide BX008]